MVNHLHDFYDDVQKHKHALKATFDSFPLKKPYFEFKYLLLF